MEAEEPTCAMLSSVVNATVAAAAVSLMTLPEEVEAAAEQAVVLEGAAEMSATSSRLASATVATAAASLTTLTAAGEEEVAMLVLNVPGFVMIVFMFSGGDRPRGVCYAFQKGESERGDGCRFSHTVDAY